MRPGRGRTALQRRPAGPVGQSWSPASAGAGDIEARQRKSSLRRPPIPSRRAPRERDEGGCGSPFPLPLLRRLPRGDHGAGGWRRRARRSCGLRDRSDPGDLCGLADPGGLPDPCPPDDRRDRQRRRAPARGGGRASALWQPGAGHARGLRAEAPRCPRSWNRRPGRPAAWQSRRGRDRSSLRAAWPGACGPRARAGVRRVRGRLQGCDCRWSCFQLLSQGQQRAADSGFDGSERISGDFGDLRVGESIEVCHLQRLSLLQRKTHDNGPCPRH